MAGIVALIPVTKLKHAFPGINHFWVGFGITVS